MKTLSLILIACYTAYRWYAWWTLDDPFTAEHQRLGALVVNIALLLITTAIAAGRKI